MNWGYKILIVYLLFVAGIIFLVVKASNEKADLVTTDYYAKELKYQQTIDETKRVEQLSSPVEINLHGREITVMFPTDFTGKPLNGELFLYCPSDEKKDVKEHFASNELLVKMKLPAFANGLYELQISWLAGGLKYYYGKKITL